MSSIKTTQVDGDVSVGRNVAMGGKANVAGDVTVGHNLKVKGWLDAPNIKGTNKGVFRTIELLNAAYPNPKDGWFAGVGTSSPFAAYVAENGEWVATGGTIEIDAPAVLNLFETTEADGFFYVDDYGFIAFRYTPDAGFDAAKVSEHFKGLVLSGLVTSADGFYYADASGNIAFQYTADGLDAAKVSNHFKEIVGGGDYTPLGNEVYTI